jgi:hypothetical protein
MRRSGSDENGIDVYAFNDCSLDHVARRQNQIRIVLFSREDRKTGSMPVSRTLDSGAESFEEHSVEQVGVCQREVSPQVMGLSLVCWPAWSNAAKLQSWRDNKSV